MSFYVYQLIKLLILSNTLNYQLSTIIYQLIYQLSAIFTKQSLKHD